MQPNSLEWLTVVGLPLTPDSINPELIARLSSKRSLIAVESGWVNPSATQGNNDYRCAQVGFDLMLQHGFLFARTLPRLECYRHILSADLWSSPTGRRDPLVVREDLISVLNRVRGEHDSEIWYITQGSPLFRDKLSERLLELGANLIDTKSSAELAYAATGSTLPLHVATSESPAQEGCANIFTSVGPYYPVKHRLAHQLTRASRVFAVNLGYETIVREISPEQVDLTDPSLNSQTLILEI